MPVVLPKIVVEEMSVVALTKIVVVIEMSVVAFTMIIIEVSGVVITAVLTVAKTVKTTTASVHMTIAAAAMRNLMILVTYNFLERVVGKGNFCALAVHYCTQASVIFLPAPTIDNKLLF